MSSIVVTQGDTWTCQAGWYNPIAGVNPPQPDLNSPVDLTGYTAKLQVRPAPGMPAVLSLTSTPPAGLTINDAEGTIDIVATAAQTGDITPGAYLWELELTSPGGAVTTIVAAASFRVREQVTV